VASGPNVHIVWWDNRDGNYEIYYKRSTDQGITWEPDLRLTNDGSWSQFPQIALIDSVIHVIWEDGRISYDNNELFYKRNPTGNPGIEEITDTHVHGLSNWKISTILTGPIILPRGMTCKVFDICGREIQNLDPAPGIYFLHTEGAITQKLIKIK
jgi:hypothetical protein